jgi:tRNA threonylcarbamoyladenosine biosynthesis protein TsaE
LVFSSQDERDTDRFGAALANTLPAGAVIALVGTLGAGKTRLVQAVANAVGIDPRDVVSPTFVLVHEYQGRIQGSAFRVQDEGDRRQASGVMRQDYPLPLTPHHSPDHQTPDHQTLPSKIYHLDAYRIRDDDEFLQLGPEEFFESDGWTFIEWADRVANCLPPEQLRIEIEAAGATQRRFAVTAVGARFGKVIDDLSACLSRSQAPPGDAL